MRSKLANVKNVQAFFVAGQALLDSSVHTPRMGVAHGPVGAGKSRTVMAWAARTNAVYVRAFATWRSPGPMLAAICEELGVSARSRHSDTMKMIAETLARSEKVRALLVDEADFIVKYPVLLDVLRDIHDLASVPVWTIGMARFLNKLLSLPEQEQFVSRITQVVEFKPLDREDAGLLLREVGEVPLGTELVDRLFKETKGSARLLRNAMEQIENFARDRNLATVTADDAKKLKFALDRRPELLDSLGLHGAALTTV